MRRFGLANTADVVALALDGHQRGALDGARIDEIAAHSEAAIRQILTLEHPVDRLQIEIRGQLHYRSVFVVKGAGRGRALAIALDQMPEHSPMRLDMAIEIHAEKPGELKEPGIDAA